MTSTSQRNSPQSPLDTRFGRAKCFIVVDMEGGRFSAVDNSGQRGVDPRIHKLITGQPTPKAFTTLRVGGLKVHTGAFGIVAEAIAQMKAGQLVAVKSADGTATGGIRV